MRNDPVDRRGLYNVTFSLNSILKRNVPVDRRVIWNVLLPKVPNILQTSLDIAAFHDFGILKDYQYFLDIITYHYLLHNNGLLFQENVFFSVINRL